MGKFLTFDRNDQTMNSTLSSSIIQVAIQRVEGGAIQGISDKLAIEEPLEVSMEYKNPDSREVKTISVTMRTPGQDKNLALGFLFTEGIICSMDAVEDIKIVREGSVKVVLKAGFKPNLNNVERNFYTTSSCGVCGKGSIEAIKTVSLFKDISRADFEINLETLYSLPNTLRNAQNNFENTGGIHASGLFNADGDLLVLREDVGRHNALDKLIGEAFESGFLPLDTHILLLSGRASFELIQKAVMAGIQAVVAIGAPSSLAVELAQENSITLIGFLKQNRFNIYTQSEKIKIIGL